MVPFVIVVINRIKVSDLSLRNFYLLFPLLFDSSWSIYNTSPLSIVVRLDLNIMVLDLNIMVLDLNIMVLIQMLIFLTDRRAAKHVLLALKTGRNWIQTR